ncbi:unnamed protein product [Amaranthus hypochondriacus]
MEYCSFKCTFMFIILLIVVYLPTLCYSQEKSKATYFGSPDCKGNPSGACGYGDYGRTVNDGDVAAVSRLYKNGAGCGACYQVKCSEEECNEDGVKVVVTDHGVSNEADFILSGQAFSKMAKSGMENNLKAYGHVNVEYQRISCQYPANNLMLKVHEHSRYPNYLALLFYYQSGIYDITAVEIFEEANLRWRACRRAYGAVWDVTNPPKGSLTIRFFVASSVQAKWMVAANVIPPSWTPGVAYDTSLQL